MMAAPALPEQKRGTLRSGVHVTFSDIKVIIRYSLWESSIPASWVEQHPIAIALLERRSTRSEALRDPELAPLVRLLEEQGCFLPEESRSHRTLLEVRSLFEPMRSEWYSAYYSHPAWNRFRHGVASRSELLAWIIHNYHVSRAAGPVAARMAAQGRYPAWRPFFRQDALEEFWHCDAYYFVDTPTLSVSVSDIKAYVPLPSSLAFEEHALQVAETDPLAHSLIAYFQESSIVFKEHSEEFHRQVERAYGLGDFFHSWEKHIQIDIDQEHAGGLRNLFDDERQVDRDSLARAFRNAWLGFYFLWSALDDIRAEEQGSAPLSLRLPIRDGLLDARLTSLCRALPSALQAPRDPIDLDGLYSWYLAACSGGHPGPRVPDSVKADAAGFLWHGVALTALRALGFGREHDDIMVCGRLAELFGLQHQPATAVSPRSPWSVAVIGHLAEAAARPGRWVALVGLLLERARPALGRDRPRLECLDTAISLIARYRGSISLSPADRDRWLTHLLQLDELLVRWFLSATEIPDEISLV